MSNPILKDFLHAQRLYRDGRYARAPKVGFLYFVHFNINRRAVIDEVWANKKDGPRDVGLLVKKIDLPKFEISTETINQYNRWTKVQTSLKYQPVNIEFHDDNNDITNGLWENYYKYNFVNGTYASDAAAFADTKYQDTDYLYGIKNKGSSSIPFLTSIEIYVLHQRNFTQMTLVNPIITNWNHDNLDQDAGSKILSNKITVGYENVIYDSGIISGNSEASEFQTRYYDTAPSPILGAKIIDTTQAPGASPLSILRLAKQTYSFVKNVKMLTKAGLKQDFKNLAYGVAGNIEANLLDSNAPPLTSADIANSVSTGISQSRLGFVINTANSINTQIVNATPSKLTGTK
jgi:hypothetical protein